MKKSFLKGLFLLFCAFFLSNADVSAQTFRDVVEIKGDIPAQLSQLETEYQGLDKNDSDFREQADLVKKKINSLKMFENELDNEPTEKLLAIVLSKHSDDQFTVQDYYAGDYASAEVRELRDFLYNFLTE